MSNNLPANGTICENNTWFFDGKHGDFGTKPVTVNGQWGEWRSWSDYSRCSSCGSGASYIEGYHLHVVIFD
jgi:hypothetical protein